jgi:hypothetical protein
MSDASPLAGFLDRAEIVAGLARSLGTAFCDEQDHGNLGRGFTVRNWERHKLAFDQFCRAIRDLEKEIQLPPQGAAAVAHWLDKAGGVAQHLWHSLANRIPNADNFAVYMLWGELEQVGEWLSREVETARKAHPPADPFAFLDERATPPPSEAKGDSGEEVSRLPPFTPPVQADPHNERQARSSSLSERSKLLLIGQPEQIRDLARWLDDLDRAVNCRVTDGQESHQFVVDPRALNKALACGIERLACLNPTEATHSAALIGELQRDVACVLSRGIDGVLEPTAEQEEAGERLQAGLRKAMAYFHWLGVRVRGKLAVDATPGQLTADASGRSEANIASSNAAELGKGGNVGSTPPTAKPNEGEGTGGAGSPNGQTAVVSGLGQLEPADRKAYFTYSYAEYKLGKQTDREAYDWLMENGLPDESESAELARELAGYTLPVFATWARQLRNARKVLGEQKHNRRSGRAVGGSIARGDEIERMKGDEN